MLSVLSVSIPQVFSCAFFSLSADYPILIWPSMTPGFGSLTFHKLPSMVCLVLIPNVHSKDSDWLSLGQVPT